MKHIEISSEDINYVVNTFDKICGRAHLLANEDVKYGKISLNDWTKRVDYYMNMFVNTWCGRYDSI